MAQRLLTEAGQLITMETIPGVLNASPLNDTNVFVITKETFTTNPVLNGWLVGAGWEWDEEEGNMKPI
jgi:hypothetical protein